MSRSHYAGIKSSNFLGHRGNFQTGMLVPYLLVTQLTTMMQEHFLKSSHSVCARGIIFFYMSRFDLFCFGNWSLRWFVTWTIVLGRFRICGAFFNTHMPNPFLRPKHNVGHASPHFFPNFNIVKGGRRDNCNKISEACNVLWGKLEIKQNYEHWSTFPTIFLSRVVWILGFRTTMFSPFNPRLLSILDTIRQPRAIVMFSK